MISRKRSYTQVALRGGRNLPSLYLLKIVLIPLHFHFNDDEKANPLVQETCKIIRSVINITSSCLFPPITTKFTDRLEPPSYRHLGQRSG